ncbi:hypothetical protein ABKN59_009839 [Abortiporus biennis]
MFPDSSRLHSRQLLIVMNNTWLFTVSFGQVSVQRHNDGPSTTPIINALSFSKPDIYICAKHSFFVPTAIDMLRPRPESLQDGSWRLRGQFHPSLCTFHNAIAMISAGTATEVFVAVRRETESIW